jgi:hypothetical protein
MGLFALLSVVAAIAFGPGPTVPGTGAGGTRAEATSKARGAALAVRRTRPLVVAGSRFLPHERVRVDAAGEVRRVRARRSGDFVVRFTAIDACNGVTIVARGSGGSRASVTFAQLSNVHCL